MTPYVSVWEAFRHMEATADGRHDTPDWRTRPGPYALCIVRVPADILQPGLGDLRRDLNGLPNIRVHPDHFLHIALQELGFVVDTPARPDELSSARLEEFAQAAAVALSNLSPISIGIGGANSFQDAVFLDVDRGEPLWTIHERLFELAAIPQTPTFPYLPHCTIAHYLGGASPRDVIPVIAPWREEICGEIDVTEIEIVTLDPSQPYPELESYAVLPIGP